MTTIQEELDAVRKMHKGILYPKDVVEAARSKTSAMHKEFEWDDTEAAQKWRIEQARKLIRIFVEVVDDGRNHKSSRVFVALRSENNSGGGYRLMADVLSDEELRKQLLLDAYNDMQSFAQKYASLKELTGVFRAIRRVKAP